VRETSGMIARGLKKAEIEIEPEALELLTELIAGNKGGLDAEMAKLVNYKEAGETLTTDDVRSLTAGYEVYNVFELADYIVQGSVNRVLRMVRKLLANGNSPVGLGVILQNHFINLYLVKNGRPMMGGRNWPALVQRFQRQAGRYSNAELERIIQDIAACDAGFRRSEMKPEMALEALVLGLTVDR